MRWINIFAVFHFERPNLINFVALEIADQD